jgi:hypothetical protein
MRSRPPSQVKVHTEKNGKLAHIYLLCFVYNAVYFSSLQVKIKHMKESACAFFLGMRPSMGKSTFIMVQITKLSGEGIRPRRHLMCLCHVLLLHAFELCLDIREGVQG